VETAAVQPTRSSRLQLPLASPVLSEIIAELAQLRHYIYGVR
jgi:hypothetical protein